MNNPLFKTMLAAITLTLAATTGCAVDAEEDQAPAQEAAAEKTGSESEALMIGGGSSTGSTSLWCACKLNCDNDYSGMPVLIKACKAQCDADNKCRKGVIGGSSGGFTIQ